MVRKTEVKMVEGLRGGKGTAEVHHIVTAEELRGHGKMYAKVVLAPHSSVGYQNPTISFRVMAFLLTMMEAVFR